MESTGWTPAESAADLPTEPSPDGAERPFDLDLLKTLFGPEHNRASIVSVLRAAEGLDFETHISSLDWEALRQERRPAITRMLDGGCWGDYVMLLGIVGDEAILVNSALRTTRMRRDKFCRTWSGWVMILDRRPGAERPAND